MPRQGMNDGNRRPQYDEVRGHPELICAVAEDVGVEITPSGASSALGADVAGLNELAAAPDIVLKPLFDADLGRLGRQVHQMPQAGESADHVQESLSRMVRFYQVDAPEERLEEIAERLRRLDVIEAAYIKPAAQPARAETGARPWTRPFSKAEERSKESPINDMAPTGPDAPSMTPDYTVRQIYLDPGPAGINSRHAWQQPGGTGHGVQVIDCEWGWRFGHEDLLQNQGGVISGINSTDTDHGTAVLGEISGDVNGFGVTGIAPDAVISASSFSLPTATAIRAAADRLGPGDVLLLEIHRPGPRATGTGQQGFIAVEWWPDDFLAIRYATDKGVVVVEAAGNGAENLDDRVYDGSPGFPRGGPTHSGATRSTPVPSSSAPELPPGTHGADWGPDRSRLDFSNFGSCVDAQGWGREVTTTGYGDLQAGGNPDFWYTDRFSGTSSASPIVVGAVACVQGVLKASDRIPLDGWQVRNVLRNTGWPQQDAPGRPASQRIGNRPDLSQLIPAALA